MFRIDTEVIALIVAYLLATNNTFLIHITKRHCIGRSFTTTSDTQRIALYLCIVLKHRTYPISINQVTISIINTLERRPIIGLTARIDTFLIHNSHVLLRIKQFSFSSNSLPTLIGIKTDFCTTSLTTLCCDKNNTIGSLSTINSSRSGVLQDIDTLNVGWIQG